MNEHPIRSRPRRAAQPARPRPRRHRARRAACILSATVIVAGLGLVLGEPASAAHLGATSAHALTPMSLGSATHEVASLETVVKNATAWLVKILATIATFFLTLGGVRYLMAGGDPSALESAKGSLKNAAIGYALALLAPGLMTILQSILGLR